MSSKHYGERNKFFLCVMQLLCKNCSWSQKGELICEQGKNSNDRRDATSIPPLVSYPLSLPLSLSDRDNGKLRQG